MLIMLTLISLVLIVLLGNNQTTRSVQKKHIDTYILISKKSSARE